ncbi:MAG: BON domain-containing protein, partial [Acidobacteria bacterium]|nr:BON domain-containing protein [Acidobacteriota bacterium]
MRQNLRTVFLLLVAALSMLIGCSQPPTPTHAQDGKQDATVGQRMGDAATTAKIKTTYLFNPHLNSFRIDVDTRDDVVTLQGVVKTGIQKDLAGEIAKNASGVEAVHNELKVSEGAVGDPDEVDRTFTQATLDATTTASVKMALALTRGVKASDINVSTRWGTVT